MLVSLSFVVDVCVVSQKQQITAYFFNVLYFGTKSSVLTNYIHNIEIL